MMIRPTRRVDGRRLSRRDRAAFLGVIDEPQATEVFSDGLDACTFRGWVASTRHRRMTVRAHVDGQPAIEVPSTDARPDVIEALGAEHGLEDPACGFQFELPLPETPESAVPVVVEFADGEFVAESPHFRILRTKGDEGVSKASLAAAHLRGEGVEFGAMHLPLEVDRSQCVVRYGDRLTKAQAQARFPELHQYTGFVDTDILIDLNLSDLSELAPRNFDFFIANDVIEHLANPVRFLKNVHDVMEPGAVLFLSVPDRDYTFDVGRPLTTIDHLWDEYERDVTIVDNAHIRDFIVDTEPGGLPRHPLRRRQLIRQHRERSVHVHVWTRESFDEFLAETCARLGLQFEVIEQARSEHANVYVLQRRDASA